jgi:hypothetical protein
LTDIEVDDVNSACFGSFGERRETADR